MLQERLSKQALLGIVKEKMALGRQWMLWNNYIEDIGWNCFRLPLVK